jgi:hypothetical protein
MAFDKTHFNMKEPIIIAPTLADASTVVIYRSNGRIVSKTLQRKNYWHQERKTEY